jgi:hypothetical protein
MDQQKLPRRPDGKTVTPNIDYAALHRHFLYTIDKAEQTYDLDDPDRQPPASYFSKCRTQEEREAYAETACKKANKDKKAEAARQWVNERKADLKKIERLFEELLFAEEKDKWPKKWQIKDKLIRKMLDRTRWADVMNYLWGITTNKETQELRKFLNGNPEKLVLFTVNIEIMAYETKMSASMAYKYIREFSRLGIIKEVGKTEGRNGQKIYSIGTWVKWGEEGRPRRNAYIKESLEWKKKLRAFDVQPG